MIFYWKFDGAFIEVLTTFLQEGLTETLKLWLGVYWRFDGVVSVHEKIDILNERLEAAGGDKIDDGPQGGKASTSIKKCEYPVPGGGGGGGGAGIDRLNVHKQFEWGFGGGACTSIKYVSTRVGGSSEGPNSQKKMWVEEEGENEMHFRRIFLNKSHEMHVELS